MIATLKRHSGFLAAAGICAWAASGLPLVVRLSPETPSAATPSGPQWFEVTAFLVFGIVLAAAILGRHRSTSRLVVLLALQAACLLVMGFQSSTVVIFPLLVLVAWQATLIFPLRIAMAWIGVQTAILWAVLWPNWNSVPCQITLAIFVAFQFFGVFAARMVRDENAHAEELQRINAELRATRTLLADAVRSEERVRISRELHDAWGHHLTALNLQLEYSSHIASGALRDNLDEAKALSRSLLTKVRDVVGSLRIEASCDLSAVLKELTAGIRKPSIDLKVPASCQAPSYTHAEVVLRCTQEAITNARKHSDAEKVRIDLTSDSQGLCLRIRDDGTGTTAPEPGNGLRGMRDRVTDAGGQMHVTIPPEGGVVLEIWLPGTAS